MKKKPRLKFNPGLALIDLRTTGPRAFTSLYRAVATFALVAVKSLVYDQYVKDKVEWLKLLFSETMIFEITVLVK